MQHTITTSADGSTTLQLTEFNESYHSSNGAYTEAMHIYIKNGVEHLFSLLQGKDNLAGSSPFTAPSASHSAGPSACINIFDVGFGTALNCILTWAWQQQRRREGLPYPRIAYYGIEKYPIQPTEAQKLNYPNIIAQHNCLIPDKTSETPTYNKASEALACDKVSKTHTCNKASEALAPGELGDNYHSGKLEETLHTRKTSETLAPCELGGIFSLMHTCPWEQDVEISPGFILHKSCADIAALQEEYYREAGKSAIKMEPDGEADTPAVVFYDTFSPATQPELWDEAIFRSIATGCTPGSVLVTYCCKGTVKQALRSCGFNLERLPGPPGKRHILRATLPQSSNSAQNAL